MSRKILLLLFLGMILAVGAGVVPLFSSSSNCGGNSAALSAVGYYVKLALFEAMDEPEQVFRVTAATTQQREQLTRLPGASWLHGARLLVSPTPVAAEPTVPRRIVIVCDKSYTNVPRRWFGSAPPTHAVGYSDGTTGLISSNEFATLDQSSFVALDELFPSSSRQ